MIDQRLENSKCAIVIEWRSDSNRALSAGIHMIGGALRPTLHQSSSGLAGGDLIGVISPIIALHFDDSQGKVQGRKMHGNEKMVMFGRSSGELSGPFCFETPHFYVRCPQIVWNCSRELSLEHCHCHAFLVPKSGMIIGKPYGANRQLSYIRTLVWCSLVSSLGFCSSLFAPFAFFIVFHFGVSDAKDKRLFGLCMASTLPCLVCAQTPLFEVNLHPLNQARRQGTLCSLHSPHAATRMQLSPSESSV